MVAAPSPEEVAADLAHLGLPVRGPLRLEPIPGDAGARSYLRVRHGGGSLILMQVPLKADLELGGAPAAGGELPYLNVGRYLAGLGLPVPKVHGWDPGTRRLYQEDFGSRPLSVAAGPGPEGAAEAYRPAVDLLAEFQRLTSRPDPECLGFRRRFEPAAVRSELAEFAAAGLPHRASRAPSAAEAARLDVELDAVAAEVAALPACFSHRDYHADNLLCRPEGGIGIIDFQDAFLAPRFYDLASLLTDRTAPVRLGSGLEPLLDRFSAARGIPPAAARREFWTAALQRQLKVACRFVNLARRGKPAYLDYLPATWGVIARALPRAGRGGLGALLSDLGCPV